MSTRPAQKHPLHLLIKPVSGSCNMSCVYCFYCDEMQKRSCRSFGKMSMQTAETLIQKALDGTHSTCTFAFQGGEPTLWGLSSYKAFTDLIKQHNTKKTPVHFALQTNGFVIDNEWAEFFAKEGFLIGLSLDGNKRIHDALRSAADGRGSFNKTLHAAQLFDNHKVEYNILTVVSALVAKDVKSVYEFYLRNNFIYQQYIPCLDPIGEAKGKKEWSLTPQAYGRFLKNLFDLWYRSFKRGKQISVRYFDNLLLILLGRVPESCGMLGHCTFQHVIEADGSVYPCDFYVLDGYKLGNINTDTLSAIADMRKKIGFIEKSLYVNEECKNCKWYNLCRGGCRRDRDSFTNAPLEKNYFCSAYKDFFAYAQERLIETAHTIQRQQAF